jgi:hypothetical protein
MDPLLAIPAHASAVRRGFSFTDLALTLACLALLSAAALPVVAAGRRAAGVDESLDNLLKLGLAHAMYAADWNGRQVTPIADDISRFGSSAGPAFANWAETYGRDHPPSVLGWGKRERATHFGLYAYRQGPNDIANHALVQPIVFQGFPFRWFGSFRLANTRPLHEYAGQRFYDPVFYPPNDVVVRAVVEPAFDDPDEFVYPLEGVVGTPAWSSYCLSPAAMFDPDVMRHPDAGGWQDPWSLDDGFRSPGLFQARHPDLKSLMIEHHWNQNAPEDRCNPAFDPGTYDGCEPWYFNHGRASEPATLFYDLAVRLLPNVEAEAADERVRKQTGHGLWSRDTPFGADGYLAEHAYDDLRLSHHVLTTEGILGRDTVNPPRP